jgi:hypothetical protein
MAEPTHIAGDSADWYGPRWPRSLAYFQAIQWQTMRLAISGPHALPLTLDAHRLTIWFASMAMTA